MPRKDQLEAYLEMRDFAKTPEPAGHPGKRQVGSPKPRFVIQKHRSKNIHYDLRLEVEGVLKSWAVPKGPSINPRDKRLAVPTEDHPLDYIDFEGVIPEGQHGAGTVIVWDTGTYVNVSKRDGKKVPIEEALKAGHASFVLDGTKLWGGFSLTRTGMGKDERWILVKGKDEEADYGFNILLAEPDSALTGRSLDEVALEGKIR